MNISFRQQGIINIRNKSFWAQENFILEMDKQFKFEMNVFCLVIDDGRISSINMMTILFLTDA